MTDIVEDLRLQQHQDSTRKNYYTVWKLFNNFFIKLDQKSRAWEDCLTLFVGYLIENDKQSSTVRSYISVVKAVLKIHKIKIQEDQYLFSALTRACRLKNDCLKTRLPIHRNLLEVILRATRDFYRNACQPYLGILYYTIFVSMYFGLLQFSEVTTGAHPILARDLAPQMVKISSARLSKKCAKSGKMKTKNPGSEFCPYRTLRRYIGEQGGYLKGDEPFFIFWDRSPVTPRHVSYCLKLILSHSGFQQEFYGTHSFHAGRSCDLFNIGISIENIKKLGRWCSNAVF